MPEPGYLLNLDSGGDYTRKHVYWYNNPVPVELLLQKYVATK